MKLLLMFLTLSTNLICADNSFESLTPTPIMGFRIPEKLEFQTIDMFYKQAVKEYKNANYGTSKELFEATVQRTDAFPKAYFYLGDIYGNIDLPFKNLKVSKSYYNQCISHRKSNTEIKQLCYIRLSWMEGIAKSELDKYKMESKKLGDNYYSKWLDVGDGERITESLRKAQIAQDSKKSTDKDIFQRANYIVGE